METDAWEQKYVEHASFLERNFTYLWKGKYPCTLSHIGIFGCQAYFKDEDVHLTVDTWDIYVPLEVKEIIKQRTAYKCSYAMCNYACGSVQVLGKHYVKIHKERHKGTKKKK